MTGRGQAIALRAGDGFEFHAYRVAPGGVRRGGLIVVQEIFGVTEHIRDVADGYAAAGYEVLAPQLFDRLQRDFEAGYGAADIDRARALAAGVDWDKAVLDLQACIDHLGPAGPVFMTGYCWGGSACWVASCRCTGLAAASGYYGRLIVEFVRETPRNPVILHFGSRDPTIPSADVEAIRQAHPQVPVYLYDAGHGFNSDRRADFDAHCAELARARTLDLFAQHGSGA